MSKRSNEQDRKSSGLTRAGQLPLINELAEELEALPVLDSSGGDHRKRNDPAGRPGLHPFRFCPVLHACSPQRTQPTALANRLRQH